MLIEEVKGGFRAVSWTKLLDRGEVSLLSLAAEDVDGDGTDEVLFHAETYLGWNRGRYQLAVLEVEPPRLRVAFQGGSALPAVVADLDGEAAEEIALFWPKTLNLNAEWRPMWLDVHRLRGGRWEVSNQAFPELYDEVVADFEQAEKQAPQDEKVLDYLGRAYAIVGEKEKALGAWSRAARGYRRLWRRTQSASWRRALDEMAQLREELGAS
ncbi:MAG: hypothetical protein ACE5R4_05620 [Armatimonadota bacterium]